MFSNKSNKTLAYFMSSFNSPFYCLQKIGIRPCLTQERSSALRMQLKSRVKRVQYSNIALQSLMVPPW
jgi:hypothetical protein